MTEEARTVAGFRATLESADQTVWDVLVTQAGISESADSSAVAGALERAGTADISDLQRALLARARDYFSTGQRPDETLADLGAGPARTVPFVSRRSHILSSEPPDWIKEAATAAGSTPIRRVFVGPNRGDPVIRSLRAIEALSRELGYHIETVVMYSDGDENAEHLRQADHVIYIPGGKQAYLTDRLVFEALDQLKAAGYPVDRIDPGWGFRSEKPDFAAEAERRGIRLLGPLAETMRAFGSKTEAKKFFAANGVPVSKGSDNIPILANGEPDIRWAETAAQEIGYPVMVKPSEGGGGKGMKDVHRAADLGPGVSTAVSFSKTNFGSDKVSIEKLIDNPRHLEFQIIADGTGRPEGVHIVGIRYCSAQRSFQKMFEWSGPGLVEEEKYRKVAEGLKKAFAEKRYKGPATAEFLEDAGDKLYFMEVNTRLQVEHVVTEERFGIDLKKEVMRMDMGLGPSAGFLERTANPVAGGPFVINFRLQAEKPYEGFVGSPGKIKFLLLPTGPNIRVDSAVQRGSAVSASYDSMIAKITATGNTWEEAIANLERALMETVVAGIDTNIEFGLEVLRTDEMRSFGGKEVTVPFLGRYLAARHAVIKGGDLNATLAQDKTLDGKPREIEAALALAGKYKDAWLTPKPFQDEAIFSAAVAAYKERRIEIERSLLGRNPLARITPDTLPHASGLSFKAVIDGREADVHVREVHLGRFAVTVNGRTAFAGVRRLDKYQYSVDLIGKRKQSDQTHFGVVVDGERGAFDVQIKGIHHHIKIASSLVTKEKGKVEAALTANVWLLAKKDQATGKLSDLRVGDHVQKGDQLLVLESMKMEIPSDADCDGVVEDILVRKGESVHPGQLLVRIRPFAGDGEGEAVKQPYLFMKDYEIGPRATLLGIMDEGSDEAAARLEGVMDSLRERLAHDAPRLVEYVGDYLIGFDYTESHIQKVLELLGSLNRSSGSFEKALVGVLTRYAERQELFSEERQPNRHHFQAFLRNFNQPGYLVPREFRSILRRNLAHFGIVLGERDQIAPSEKYPAYLYSNAILRMRQSWSRGVFRRGAVAELVRLAGKMKVEGAIPLIRKIYEEADARDAAAITQAALDAAKELDPRLYEELVRPLVPEKYRNHYLALQKDIFHRFNKRTETEKIQHALEHPRFVEADAIDNPIIKKLALARKAQVAPMYSPLRDAKVFLFKEGDSTRVVVLAKSNRPVAPRIEERVAVGEDYIEKICIWGMQVIGMYRSQNKALQGNELLVEIEPEILWSEQERTRGSVVTPALLSRIGANIFAFAGDKGIQSTTVLANHTDDKNRRIDTVFQFSSSSSGQLLVRIRPQDQFFRVESRADVEQHLKGKLTVGERARLFFDGGEFNAIQVEGVDNVPVPGKGGGNPAYQTVGALLARGRVNGQEVVSYFSDFRRLGGAVGDLEGQKMVAAGLYAYLNGLPIFWFNDSGGANVAEGVVSLNRSAQDFMMKLITGGFSDPETFVRYVANHPDRELFKRLLRQFGDGRSLIEQVRERKKSPLAVALMTGGNAGMVVYGPSLLVHLFMVMGEEFYGLLTGTDVIYQVQREKRSNHQIGGAPVLMQMAGTVDQVEATEERVMALAKKALEWFDPAKQFSLPKIIRPTTAVVAQLSEVDGESTEEAGDVLTEAMLRANVDVGVTWGYKEAYRNSGSLITSYARLAGRTVAIMGPIGNDGFGTREAVDKALFFVNAAIADQVPVVRVLGRRWFDDMVTADGRVAARKEELIRLLGEAPVPQISILTDPEALYSIPGNIGSDLQIFVKSSHATASDIWTARNKGCVIVENFAEAMDKAADYVKFMGSVRGESPRVQTTDAIDRKTTEIDQLVPRNLKDGYDMHRLIRALVDDGRFFEIGSGTEGEAANQDGSNQITGLASIGGIVVGIIADQPNIQAGAPPYWESHKYKRFVELCERRRIPILDLNDAPGFPPGRTQEAGNIQKVWADALRANILSTVPRVAVSLRKAFGGRFIVAGHKWLRPGIVTLASDRGQVAVMGNRGGVPFASFRKEYKGWTERTAQGEVFHPGLKDTFRDAGQAFLEALELWKNFLVSKEAIPKAKNFVKSMKNWLDRDPQAVVEQPGGDAEAALRSREVEELLAQVPDLGAGINARTPYRLILNLLASRMPKLKESTAPGVAVLVQYWEPLVQLAKNFVKIEPLFEGEETYTEERLYQLAAFLEKHGDKLPADSFRKSQATAFREQMVPITAVSGFIREYRSIDDSYPFMLMDAVKAFLASYRALLPQQEQGPEGGQSNSSRGVLEGIEGQIRIAEDLLARYDREIGDPGVALRTGVIDAIISLEDLRSEVHKALLQAQRLATAAFGRDWSTTTRAEAVYHYAVARLQDLNIDWHPVVHNPNDSSADAIAIDGIEGEISPTQLLEILTLSETRQEDLRGALREYLPKSADDRGQLLAKWRLEAVMALTRRQVMENPSAAIAGLLAGVGELTGQVWVDAMEALSRGLEELASSAGSAPTAAPAGDPPPAPPPAAPAPAVPDPAVVPEPEDIAAKLGWTAATIEEVEGLVGREKMTTARIYDAEGLWKDADGRIYKIRKVAEVDHLQTLVIDQYLPSLVDPDKRLPVADFERIIGELAATYPAIRAFKLVYFEPGFSGQDYLRMVRDDAGQLGALQSSDSGSRSLILFEGLKRLMTRFDMKPDPSASPHVPWFVLGEGDGAKVFTVSVQEKTLVLEQNEGGPVTQDEIIGAFRSNVTVDDLPEALAQVNIVEVLLNRGREKFELELSATGLAGREVEGAPAGPARARTRTLRSGVATRPAADRAGDAGRTPAPPGGKKPSGGGTTASAGSQAITWGGGVVLGDGVQGADGPARSGFVYLGGSAAPDLSQLLAHDQAETHNAPSTSAKASADKRTPHAALRRRFGLLQGGLAGRPVNRSTGQQVNGSSSLSSWSDRMPSPEWSRLLEVAEQRGLTIPRLAQRGEEFLTGQKGLERLQGKLSPDGYEALLVAAGLQVTVYGEVRLEGLFGYLAEREFIDRRLAGEGRGLAPVGTSRGVGAVRSLLRSAK